MIEAEISGPKKRSLFVSCDGFTVFWFVDGTKLKKRVRPAVAAIQRQNDFSASNEGAGTVGSVVGVPPLKSFGLDGFPAAQVPHCPTLVGEDLARACYG